MAMPDNKVCTICKIDKPSEEYSINNGKLRSACKECSNKIRREKRAETRNIKEEIQSLMNMPEIKEEIQICLCCNQEKNISNFEIVVNKRRKHCIKCHTNNKTFSSIKKELKNEKLRKNYYEKMQCEEERIERKLKMKSIYEKNKDKINKQHKEYRESNKEKEKERHAKYYQNNKEAVHSYRRKYYDDNPMKKLMLKLRQRLSKYYISGKECPDLLNCDMKFLQKWFSYHFELDEEKDMNFSNHGSHWHIDHVIPCCYFDASDDAHKRQCFSWSNLRPLPATENSEKNGNINENHIAEQNIRLQKFCKIENIPLIQIALFESQDASIVGTS